MRTLPTGTVTFVFTDIEGSTSMLQRLGDDTFLTVLEEHNALVRGAFAAGVEVRTEGDSFFYVFPSAADAIEASVRAQQALDAHGWPEGAAVRIRVGIHTGHGRLGGGDYVGLDVHRAARISSAGHGGQILASREAVTAGGDSVERIDLGSHRFKDIDAAEHVFQVVAPGLSGDFPPIRSLDVRPNNLPAQPSGFVGRDRESVEITEFLERSRLVTITGPGGVGKTRLAVHVAAGLLSRYQHGVVYVPLDAIREESLVVAAIASALDLEDDGTQPTLELITRRLSDRHLLLVIDNFEHVLGAAADVAAILQGAPGVRALVTSQARLRIDGEQAYPVPPLERVEAAELFAQRVAAADPAFTLDDAARATVAEIVERLEALPLAMELAAARVPLFGLDGLLQRLHTSVDLESRSADVPDRHRTLDAAIAWSYDLLTSVDQRAMRRLAVFDGGFVLDGAEAVAGEDAIESVASLMDKSLIRSTAIKGQTRFTMLDSIRRFGLTAMSDHERAESRAAHAAYFAGIGAEARRHLETVSQQVWLDRLALEHDNLRAVARRSRATGDPDPGLWAFGGIARYFHRRGHLAEARATLEQLLAIEGASVTARAEGLNGLGDVLYWQGDFPEAAAVYEELAGLFGALGEPRRVANTLFALSTTASFMDDFDRALTYMAEAKTAFEALGDDEGLRRVIAAEALATWRSGRLPAALALWKETNRLYAAVGDRGEELQSLLAIAAVTHELGRQEESIAAIRSALDGMLAADDIGGVIGALDFAGAILASRQPENALRLAAATSKLTSQHRMGLNPTGFGLRSARDQAAERLDAHAVDARWAEGLGLDYDDAVTLAREMTTPAP